MNRGFWLPKATTPPPPAPPAPPLPPSLRLTADEREAVELFATLEWTSMRWSDRMNGWFIVDIRTLECEADIPCSVCDKWL